MIRRASVSSMNLGSALFVPPPPRYAARVAIPRKIHSQNTFTQFLKMLRHIKQQHLLRHAEDTTSSGSPHASPSSMPTPCKTHLETISPQVRQTMPNAFQTDLRVARQWHLSSLCNPDLQQSHVYTEQASSESCFGLPECIDHTPTELSSSRTFYGCLKTFSGSIPAFLECIEHATIGENGW